jgi:hypothetical protein
VSIQDLPAYLRSVTFLESPGNVPAEVAASVDRMTRERRRKKLRLILPIALVVLAVAGAAAWYFTTRGPATQRVGKDGAPAMLVPAGQ